ncbi:RHS repeat-associated core domain-containing protein, partial [Escherichia coli]|nr:RHS repeat-associated core domain-containing protein [Escherichia coli]
LKPDHYDEQITGYDKNGNMLGLKRYGPISANGYGLIDNLSVTLDGNQLVSVNDAATVSAFNNGFDFKDGSKQATEYFYDDNGSLIKDLNKKNTNIQYNCLHLPDRVEFEDGSSISYLYDAAGIKLRVVHSTAGKTTTTDYCGSVIYENGNPKTILTEAGFVSLNDNKYHYYLQDHQGNNRVVADQNGNVEEINHYYPFGGIFANTSSNQPYKYNGKEWDKEYGLNWYDYGARMYDPALGRWHVVDPSSEKYYGVTPYAYCNNNPIKNIDLDGRDWYLHEATGQLYYNKGMNQKQITFNDNLYTRVGANNMLGDMKDITEKSYDYEESVSLAQAHGYAINPIQYITSEDSREQPYTTGKKSVSITTGKIEIVNERYGVFTSDKDKVVGVKTEPLFTESLKKTGKLD